MSDGGEAWIVSFAQTKNRANSECQGKVLQSYEFCGHVGERSGEFWESSSSNWYHGESLMTTELICWIIEFHSQSSDSQQFDRLSVTSSDCDVNEILSSNSSRSWITYCTWLVYFLVWATLFAIALELQFGAVFFMLSCFLGICLNLRDKSKNSNEISAYSVFNRNCESIDGTFKAEMFEQQLGVRKLWK